MAARSPWRLARAAPQRQIWLLAYGRGHFVKAQHLWLKSVPFWYLAFATAATAGPAVARSPLRIGAQAQTARIGSGYPPISAGQCHHDMPCLASGNYLIT
jgi:hypothetical protein